MSEDPVQWTLISLRPYARTNFRPRPSNTRWPFLPGSPTVGLSAGPEIARIRLVLLVSRAVCFLDQRKASHFVKASGPHIALERPKLQAIERAFGDLQQLSADATSLRVWQHVQLVDPVLSEGDHSGHPGAVESTPDLAGFKHALPKEPLVFLGRMETGERRQGVIERGSNDPRGGVHVFKPELP